LRRQHPATAEELRELGLEPAINILTELATAEGDRFANSHKSKVKSRRENNPITYPPIDWNDDKSLQDRTKFLWCQTDLAGKHSSKQDWHYDYVIPNNMDGPMPFSVLFALHPGTLIHVTWNGGGYMVPIEVGDIFIFDGAVYHAGAAYSDFNIRVFMYFPTSKISQKDQFGREVLRFS
jgi:hypothetical protein